MFKLCPAQAMTGAVAKGDMESLQEAQLAMAEYQKLIETAKKRKLEAEDNAPLTPRASAKSRAVASPRASAPVARAVAEAGAAASAVEEGAAAGAVAAARAVAKAGAAARAAAKAGAALVVRSAAPRDHEQPVLVRRSPAFPKGPNSFIGPMIRFPQDVGVQTITVK